VRTARRQRLRHVIDERLLRLRSPLAIKDAINGGATQIGFLVPLRGTVMRCDDDAFRHDNCDHC